jgi:hypothetical protein
MMDSSTYFHWVFVAASPPLFFTWIVWNLQRSQLSKELSNACMVRYTVSGIGRWTPFGYGVDVARFVLIKSRKMLFEIWLSLNSSNGIQGYFLLSMDYSFWWSELPVMWPLWQ